MKRKIIWSFALLACLCCLPSAKTKAQTKNAAIIPGEVWKDTDGNPINAHGGGLLYHEGTYYWYGEYKKGETILPEWYVGMLPHRRNRCQLLLFERPAELEVRGYRTSCRERRRETRPAPQQGVGTSQSDLQRKNKEIRHVAHVESADYSKACAGVAVSDSPTGTFTYVAASVPTVR